MKAALVALLVLGCGKPAAEKPNGGSMNKPGSGSQASFVKGVSLKPSDKLVEWMDKQKRGKEARLLRLVIVVPSVNGGFDISKAKIGDLEVYANDAALGVGLADRADTSCGGAASCAFHAEGYWRGKQLGGLQFDVMKAEYLPADQVAAKSFAEVEGESGN